MIEFIGGPWSIFCFMVVVAMVDPPPPREERKIPILPHCIVIHGSRKLVKNNARNGQIHNASSGSVTDVKIKYDADSCGGGGKHLRKMITNEEGNNNG